MEGGVLVQAFDEQSCKDISLHEVHVAAMLGSAGVLVKGRSKKKKGIKMNEEALKVMTKYLYGTSHPIVSFDTDCSDLQHIAQAEQKLAEEIFRSNRYSVFYAAETDYSLDDSLIMRCAVWRIHDLDSTCVFEQEITDGDEKENRLAAWYRTYAWWLKEGE